MLTRREFLVATTLGLSVVPARLRAEPDSRTIRVAWVTTYAMNEPDRRRNWAAFRQELRDRGWVEGRNLAFENRNSNGDYDSLPRIVAEIVALNPDVIIASGPAVALAAKEATDRIPIVFIVGDPVGRGIVARLAKPEGNITGISFQAAELHAKRIELLLQLSPRVSRIAVLIDPDQGVPPSAYRPSMPRKVEIYPVELRSAAHLGPALTTVRALRADGALVPESGPNYRYRRAIVEALTILRLPAVFSDRTFVELGGLFSYGADLPAHLRQVAIYVDKILRGAKPADLPVEQPTAFDLAINLKTAKALGITFPRELLVRADLVIE